MGVADKALQRVPKPPPARIRLADEPAAQAVPKDGARPRSVFTPEGSTVRRTARPVPDELAHVAGVHLPQEMVFPSVVDQIVEGRHCPTHSVQRQDHDVRRVHGFGPRGVVVEVLQGGQPRAPEALVRQLPVPDG